MDRLRHEFEAIGFYLSAHPLDAYGASLEKLGIVSISRLTRQRSEGRCKLAGIVIGKRELTSRRGNRMAFVQCSDASGVFEITLFSETLAQSRELLDSAQPLLVTATAEWLPDAEEARLTVSSLEPLDQAAAQSSSGLRIFVDTPDPLSSVKSLLEREGEGRGQVLLVLGLDKTQEAEFELPRRFRLSAGIRQAIKAIPGVQIQEL